MIKYQDYFFIPWSNCMNSDAQPNNNVSIDWFLRILVKTVNKNGGEIGLTLNVGGVIISGLLCSGNDYFHQFGDTFGNALYPNDKEKSDDIAKSYHLLGDNIYPVGQDKCDEDESKITFIHMREAFFYSPQGGTIPTSAQGILWRGKLADVNGFSLGCFSKSGGN